MIRLRVLTTLSVMTIAGAVVMSPVARAQLSVFDSFNPSQAGGLCSLAHDFQSGTIWVYDCSASDFQQYSEDGSFVKSLPRPGESANDVDIDVAPEQLQLAGTTIPQGTPIFVNGESGTADIYAVDPTSGTVLHSLTTDFGNSHVVGAAYHPIRNTFFLLQDRVPSAVLENIIAEIDPETGDVLNSFQITSLFSVNYGDLDVCNTSGNLFVASSAEGRFAEFAPDGTFITYHDLPQGVSSLSGIGISCETGEAWVGGTGGTVWLLEGSVLPVELTAFDATLDGDAVLLQWRTVSETNNAGFEVQWRKGERENGGTGKWTTTAFVEGHGTTTEAQDYTYQVPDLTSGVYTFRLKQVDFDGAFEFSPEVEVVIALTAPYVLSETYPNPIRQTGELALSVREAQHVRAEVFDVLGRRVAVLHDGTLDANRSHQLRLNSAQLRGSGLYLVRVVGERFAATRRFMLLRTP
jgi:hypothetical protein